MSPNEYFMPTFQTREELQAHQLNGLQWTVAHAYNGSPDYRNKFDFAGVQMALLDHFMHGITTLKGHRLINKYKQIIEEE